MKFKNAKQAKLVAAHPKVFRKFLKEARTKLTKPSKNKFTEALMS